jgi:hypothetical protein
VAHLLMASRELGMLHHNVRLKAIPDIDVAFLFARFVWSMFTPLTGFLSVGLERRLSGTTISASYGRPHILGAADCNSLVSGGSKSRSQSPIERQRRRSDAEIDVEIGGEPCERGRQHKRQRRGDSASRGAYEGSESNESSMAIPTPTYTEGTESLRYTWLQKERLRSGPDNTWSEEEAWATNIRMLTG